MFLTVPYCTGCRLGLLKPAISAAEIKGRAACSWLGLQQLLSAAYQSHILDHMQHPVTSLMHMQKLFCWGIAAAPIAATIAGVCL